MTSLADDLLDVFMEEAAECLERLHGALEVLERSRSHDAIVEIRRDLHTFKGGARMCGLRLLSELAHAGESLAAVPLSDGDGLPPAAIRLLFAAEYELRAALQRPAEGPGSDGSLITLTEALRSCDLAGMEVAAPLQPVPAPAPDVPRQAPDARADGGSSNGTVVALALDAGPSGDHANGNHTAGQEQESADVGAAAVVPSNGGGQSPEPAASGQGGWPRSSSRSSSRKPARCSTCCTPASSRSSSAQTRLPWQKRAARCTQSKAAPVCAAGAPLPTWPTPAKT